MYISYITYSIRDQYYVWWDFFIKKCMNRWKTMKWYVMDFISIHMNLDNGTKWNYLWRQVFCKAFKNELRRILVLNGTFSLQLKSNRSAKVHKAFFHNCKYFCLYKNTVIIYVLLGCAVSGNNCKPIRPTRNININDHSELMNPSSTGPARKVIL